MTHRKYLEPTSFKCFNHYSIASSSVHIHATLPAHLILIDLITQNMAWNTNYEAPHYVTFSSLLLLLLS
jgi:hypothetical protein